MNILCLRDETRGDATASYVMVDGVFECYALEDVVRKIDGQRVTSENVAGRALADWKVRTLTAIPEGRYRLTIEQSPRFQKPMMSLHGVPGFSGIRIHGGLRPEHSEGCPLLGDEQYETAAGPRIRAGATIPAVQRLFAKVKAALERGEEVWWEVKQNPNIMEPAA